MSSNKKYWKSVEELSENSSVVETLQQKEFAEEIPVEDFLGIKRILEILKLQEEISLSMLVSVQQRHHWLPAKAL